ncbi:MAG: hypothetical protein AMXMBFR12_00330 [Candidatus Babeliales bacterium]
MKHLFILPLILIALLVLPACVPSYQQKQLKHLQSNTNIFEETKDGVLLRVHPLNKKESNDLFDGRGYYLLRNKNPLQAIQITIFNKTDHAYILNPEMIDLSLVRPEDVIKAIEYDRTAQTVIPLFIGTMGIIARNASAGNSKYEQNCATADSVVIGAGTAATALAGNQEAKNANDVLADDVHEKLLNADGLVIKPFEKISTIIVVEKEMMRPAFMMSLQRGDQSLLTYEVML